MTLLRRKHPRFRLGPEAYSELRQAVLSRDQWRCQICGAMAGLEVHHQIPRGRLGADNEQNLITLCHVCHRKRHHA
jgi:5-methylcytosine-specific restriction endonuclease McrA